MGRGPRRPWKEAMTDHDKPPKSDQPSPGDNKEDRAVDLTEADIAAADSGAAPDGEDALRAEISELNDRILRLAAELENTRRRAEREKAEIGRYAISNFARDLLSVADAFQRALASAPDEAAEISAEAVRGFVDGLKMTDKELLSVFERYGVKRIDPKGEKFDPNLHQAVAQIPGEQPAGYVEEVAQPGFTIGDRVLRAAMVLVSSGPASGTDQGASAEKGARLDTKV